MLDPTAITPLFRDCESPVLWPQLCDGAARYNAGVRNSRGGHTRTIRLTARKKLAFTVLAVGLFAVVLLLTGEIAARLLRGSLLSTDHVMSSWLLHGGNAEYPTRFDPLVGWLNRPGAHHADTDRGCIYTIDVAGYRSNGQDRPCGDVILAVGDSFTFGVGVNDSDTWPARLERMIERPVYNAGVVAYGIDQIVLRAEHLAHEVSPSLIVVAFIGDDIERCGYSARQGLKPYFVIDGDGLLAMQQPVPNVSAPSQIGAARWMLGYSYLAASVAEFRADWFGEWYIGEYFKKAHDDGLDVSRRLMLRLSHLNGVAPVLVVAINSDDDSRDVLSAASGMRTLSVGIEFGGPELGRIGGHPSPLGHEYIAQSIAKAMR